MRIRPFVLAGVLVGAAASAVRADHVPGEVLLRFRAGVSPREAIRVLDALGARSVELIPRLRVHRVRLPAGADVRASAAAFARLPQVEFAEPNQRVRAAALPNDPRLGEQWALARIRATDAWAGGAAGARGSASVVIAIVDTGIASHEDTASKLLGGYNAMDGGTNTNDDNGHGTLVAGIAAAATDNGLGVAGVAWDARLMPVKVLDCHGSGDEATVVKGVLWAAAAGARVINMSISSCDANGDCGSAGLASAEAMEVAHRAGAVLVAAAGNEGTNRASFPAAYPHVVGVAATTAADLPAAYSNYGFYIKVAAPGGDGGFATRILGPCGRDNPTPACLPEPGEVACANPGGYDAAQGTSMASPIVAGLAAVLMGQDPARSNDEVVSLIERTAEQPDGSSGWNERVGYGRVNMLRALAGTGNPPPASAAAAYAYPNPFSPGVDRFTTFVVKDAAGREVEIEILDPLGTAVRRLTLGAAETAAQDLYYNSRLRWDGRDEHGTPLANGIYLARVRIGDAWTILRVAVAR